MIKGIFEKLINKCTYIYIYVCVILSLLRITFTFTNYCLTFRQPTPPHVYELFIVKSYVDFTIVIYLALAPLALISNR